MEYYKIISEIGSALATLVAAFAGAWFAFHLQEKKEVRKEENERISNINQALVALARQYQALGNIKVEMEPFKDDELRCIKLGAVSTNRYSDIKIKVETLNFLLDSSKPSLIMEIMTEQEKFEMVLEAVHLRAERHATQLQPAFAKLGIEDLSTIQPSDLRNDLGVFLHDSLKNETDIMYTMVYEIFDSTIAVLNKLRTYAKQTYPKERFLGIDPTMSFPERGT